MAQAERAGHILPRWRCSAKFIEPTRWLMTVATRTEERGVIASRLSLAENMPRMLVLAGLLAVAPPALAEDDLVGAPDKLSLQIPNDVPGEHCAQIEPSAGAMPVTVSLHRTFHDDFDEHPLKSGLWETHYTGSVERPESFYASGAGSELPRRTTYNGEQQIYVDPGYEGSGTVPLGLDPFKVEDGVLSIIASRMPPVLKEVLFNSEYVSGILTTQKSFSQKYGYFEIRSKVPVGVGVWPAFWMLADTGGWPPEIDILEGRGQRPGDIVMTTHWRIPTTGFVQRCGFDFKVANAWADFHDYGVLWERDRIVYFIDRKPVTDVKAPASFDDPMYMIVNLAMGAKLFGGVGFVDTKSPPVVEFQVDRISAYQIDEKTPEAETAAR
jgi:beta-glucanase (GH16 family)